MKQAADNQPPAANPQPPEAWMAYVTNRWSRTLVQPLLITFMFTAFITGPLTIFRLFMPAAPWHNFAYVFFFLILETVYTTIWLKRPDQRGLNHLAYRSAEILVFTVLIRLLAWAFSGNWPTRAAWQTYLFEPLTLFEDGFFVASMILLILVWQMAIQVTHLFSDLALDQAEAAYYAEVFGHHKLETRPTITDRGKLINQFLQQWLIGGLILVFCAAFSTFDWMDPAAGSSLLNIGRLPLPGQMLLSLIFYFLAGFLLLSQGRLALLNARWLINGVQKNEQLERSWYRFSLRLLVLVAVAAAFLPLGSTIALGRIVAVIIQGISAVISFILALFIGLVSLLFSASDPSAIEPYPVPTSEPLNLLTPPAPSESSEIIRMIGSSAFWALAIVVTIMAFMFFLRERKASVDKNMWRQLWTAVTIWWRSLRQNVSRQINTARQAVQARRQRQGKRPIRLRAARRFVRLNALSPRDQLRYFYLSTVERAGQRGVTRQISETPLEFAQDLKTSWPDAEEDVETITNAFLQARYSPQPVEPEQVNPIKERWKRFQARLRRRNR